MSNPDADRGPLDVWYRRRIGDPSTDDEVVGYWLFVAGLGFALGGVVILLASTTLESGSGAGTREGGYVLGALGVALMLDGFVVGLPLDRQATRVAHGGAGLCLLAVAWFVLASPDGGAPRDVGRAVVGLYALGLAVVGVGGVLVPLLTGTESDSWSGTSAPVPPTFGEEDGTRAGAAEAGTGAAGDLDPELGEREAYLAELAAVRARFELYADAGGWRWRLVHDDGDVLADSGRGYASRRRAQQGLDAIRRTARGAPLVQVGPGPVDPEPDDGEPVEHGRVESAGADPTDPESVEAGRVEAESAGSRPVESESTAAGGVESTPAGSEPGDDGAGDGDTIGESATFVPPDDEEGRATFEVSRDEDGRWRWRLVHRDGDVLADTGRSYASERRVRRGLARVRRAAGPANYLRVDPAAFEVYRDGDGRWRWRLVHRDGDVLADSGRGYDSYRDAHEAADRAADDVDDAAVELSRDRRGEYRWRLVDDADVLAASTESHGSRHEASDAVERVREYGRGADVVAVGDAAFETYRDEAGEWRWRLRHRHGTVLAASDGSYDGRADAREAVDGVKRTAPAAEVVDG